jgi:uncharacterized membrane protein HdeD (DUF308 family)
VNPGPAKKEGKSMETTTFKNWWLVLIKGIILIILAFVIFRHPVGILMGITVYMGIGLLLTGIALIIAAIAARNDIENWGWRLAEGILDALFGIMLLANPGITAVVTYFPHKKKSLFPIYANR